MKKFFRIPLIEVTRPRFLVLLTMVFGVPIEGDAGAQGDPSPKFVGVGECRGCHGGTVVQYPNLSNAFQTWVSEDEHSKAYEHLTGDLGRHIADWMGLSLEPGAEKNWTQCTRCHAVGVDEEAGLPTFDPTTEGIGCEACHGAAEAYLVPHKSQSYRENLEAGLADLKDLRERARRCLDCHVGLEHEIVAAGHPDLNFELFHFSFWQPPHWDYREASPFKFWAIGQAAAFERTVEHLVEDSKLHRPIPEFEDEKCYRCHHKLDHDRWRQVQAHATVLRPLVKNLLGQDRAGRLEDDLEKVRKRALEELPSVRGADGGLAELGNVLTSGLVDDVSEALSSREMTPAFMKSLLSDLTGPLPQDEGGVRPHLPLAWMVQNFNDAEQVYYAFRSLIYGASSGDDSPRTTQVLTDQASSEKGEDRFERALNELYEFIKFRNIESRREAFDTRDFEKELEPLRHELDR